MFLSSADIKAKGVSVTISDGGTYVRYERTSEFADGYVVFLNGNTEVTGNYMVYKYRTDHMTTPEIWANTTENGHSGGKSKFNGNAMTDGEWHIEVVDLSIKIPNYVIAADGEYTIQWGRIDVLNTKASEGYFDLAFVAYCDNLSDIQSILTEEDRAYCTHSSVSSDNACQGYCNICGQKMGTTHDEKQTFTEAGNQRTYTISCNTCQKELHTYSFTFGNGQPEKLLTPFDIAEKASSDPKKLNMGAAEICVDEDGTAYARLHANTKATGEGYFFIIPERSTEPLGRYLVLKYRTTCNKRWQFYTGAEGTTNAGTGGSLTITNPASPDAKYYTEIVANGQWQVLVIDLVEALDEGKFLPNSAGKYPISHLRWDIWDVKGTEDRHIDIAYIGIADNEAELEAIQN